MPPPPFTLIVFSVVSRPILLSSLRSVIILAALGLLFNRLLHIRLMGPLSQWRQVGVVSHWHRQAHGCEHGVFLGLFQLALLFLETRSLGFFGLGVTFRVPREIAVLLPAPDRRHERVA